MKKPNEIKPIKDIDKIYFNAVQEALNELVGQVMHRRSNDYEPLLIVSAKVESLGRKDLLKIELLIDEKVHKVSYENWKSLRKDLITNEEYEARKDGIEALQRMREAFKKVSMKRLGRRPSKQHIRYK